MYLTYIRIFPADFRLACIIPEAPLTASLRHHYYVVMLRLVCVPKASQYESVIHANQWYVKCIHVMTSICTNDTSRRKGTRRRKYYVILSNIVYHAEFHNLYICADVYAGGLVQDCVTLIHRYTRVSFLFPNNNQACKGLIIHTSQHGRYISRLSKAYYLRERGPLLPSDTSYTNIASS